MSASATSSAGPVTTTDAASTGAGGAASTSASTSSTSTTGSSGGGDGGAGAASGAGGDGAGTGGEGGGREPSGEECLAITDQAECTAAGCLFDWGGVQILRLEDGQCIHDETPVFRCRHGTSEYAPGGAMSAFWWESAEGEVEVFLSSSFCDYLAIHPCLGTPEEMYSDEPEACRCAMVEQRCPPFPEGPPP